MNLVRFCRSALSIAAGSFFIALVGIPSASGQSSHFTGADLFKLEIATDPQISPNGKTIAYVRRSNDIMIDRARSTIWLVDVGSGKQRPLLTGSNGYFSPRWSPDGSRLAYVSADDKGVQLLVHAPATRKSTLVTKLADFPSGLAWSPDGSRIAYSMFVPGKGPQLGRAPVKPPGAKWADPLQFIDLVTYRTDEDGYIPAGYMQIFWVPARGGTPTQLTFGAAHSTGSLSWSLDGRSILFGANLGKDWERDIINSEIYRLDLDGGAPVALTDRNGFDGSPAVSPDGKLIAWVGYDDRGMGYHNRQLSVMDFDGSNKRILTASFDQSVSRPTWSSDGRSIYVFYEEKGINQLARVGLDGSIQTVAAGMVGSMLDRPYMGAIGGSQFSISQNGKIAVMAGDAHHPPDIGIVVDRAVRRLTDLNADSLGKTPLGQVKKLPVISSFDQRPIDAWIVTPPDFDPSRKYPLILEIHGGPYAAYGPVFSTDNQLYAAAGYVVVYANPRGSTSYGEEFANLIDKTFPDHDYDDLMSTVDAAIGTGCVDPDNLYVVGGSGGGLLTAWIVGKTDRFRAAVAEKPVINFASFALTSDGIYTPHWFSKYPWDDPDAYWKRSPLSLVGNVKTPTLVIVGSSDYRTPASEAEQYYTALRLKKVPTMFIKIPGANHTSTMRPSQLAAKTSAIIAWFDRYRSEQSRVQAEAKSKVTASP